MPLECASMRSIARCVLPVLVGPSTAVTPAPRARASRAEWEENDIDIKNPAGSFGNQMMTRAMIWKSLPTSGDQGDVLGTEPWEAQSHGTSQPRYPTINPVNG